MNHKERSAAWKNSTERFETQCLHCRLNLNASSIKGKFCCLGCQAAYRFIHEMDLQNFYSSLQSEKIAPASAQSDSFIALFDDAEFQKTFCETSDENHIKASLHIGGLSCYACVWLINEAARKSFPNASLKISLSSGTGEVLFDPKLTQLSRIVKMLRNLGFRVNPTNSQHAQGEMRDLVRLGVSTFCFMNIMLLAIPDYVDSKLVADVSFWHLFRILSLMLASVVMTVGAWPFYQAALRSMKFRKLHIDQSISFALIMTFGLSLWNVLRGAGPVYFDSVCAVVTLLGWGRYFQKRMTNVADRSVRGAYEYAMRYVKVVVESGEKIVPLAQVKIGDNLVLLPGDPIPLSVRVMSGDSSITYEQLTGEADAISIRAGQNIQAGALNLTSRLEVVAIQAGNESAIYKINSVISDILLQKGVFTTIADRLGSAFFLMVIVIACLIVATHWSVSPEEAMTRAIAALLIACPCAFAIAVPLTMASCAAQGIRAGIILKSQRAIEVLSKVTHVFFDKTGTLTDGLSRIFESQIYLDELDSAFISTDDIYSMAIQLPSHSYHHVIFALKEWAESKSPAHVSVTYPISSVREHVGEGIEFIYKQQTYRLGRVDFALPDVKNVPSDLLILAQGGNLVASFRLQDEILPDAAEVIEQLQSRNFIVSVLSGDSWKRNLIFAQSLKIPNDQIFAELSPTQKVEKLAAEHTTLMVGNGFNDSLALASATVSMAVVDANQSAKDAADIYLTKRQTSLVPKAITLAQTAALKIKVTFLFGLIFNLAGLTAAALGYMHPVVAAILMPASSAIVICIGVIWPKQAELKSLPHIHMRKCATTNEMALNVLL